MRLTQGGTGPLELGELIDGFAACTFLWGRCDGGRGRQRRAILGVPLSGNGDLSEMTLGGDLKDWASNTPTARSGVMGDTWSVGGGGREESG